MPEFPQMKQNQSPIVNPAGYPVDIIVKFDPITGNTELMVQNRGRTPVEMLKVAALLCQHGATLLASIIKGQTKLEPTPMKAVDNA